MNLSLWKRRIPGPDDLFRLRDEVDRTFDRLLVEPTGLLDPKLMRTEGWLPPLDISETDSEVLVRLEAPGVASKDLDISVNNRLLTIAGKKEMVEEKQGEDFYQCERRFGAFRRVVDLPETIDPDKVTAESDNGLVTIHIGKKPGAKPKQVEVKPVGKKIPVVG